MDFVAKMKVKSLSDEGFGEKVTFVCEYDDSIPEDKRFNAATPSGDCTLIINNKDLRNKLKLGDAFYLTFKHCAGIAQR